MLPGHNRDTPNCIAVHEILSLIGDKWSVLTIIQLREKEVRFNELRRRVAGISQRMLTKTLRRLEQDGMVHRTVYPTVPVKVEYGLTPLGESLLVPVLALAQWAEEHRQDVSQARLEYSESSTTEE